MSFNLGKIFRGNRLKNCENAGAIGVIMYSDPQQVAPDGTDPDSVYPNTFSLPPSGVQRGGTLIDIGRVGHGIFQNISEKKR